MAGTRFSSLGYTVLELMVVIGIVAILVAAGVPSLQDTLRRNARDSVVMEMLSSISLARTQAVTRSANAAVCRSTNLTSCAGVKGADWDDGWIVFVDIDGDGVVDTSDGDEIVQTHPAGRGVVTIRLADGSASGGASLDGEYVGFDNDGFLANSTTGEYFKFCDPDNIVANARAIWISNSGRPSRSIDDGDGVHDDLTGNDLSCP